MINLFLNINKYIPAVTGNKIVRALLVLKFLFLGLYCHAQFPVQVTPQLVAPYTVFLSEYYTGTYPKIFVTLTNRDLQRPTVSVRLRMTIKGQQVVLTSKDNVFYPSIQLDAGIPLRLSLNDLAPYFNPANLNMQGISLSEYQQQGRVPEGSYEFCFEAVEVNTGQVVSRKECAYAFISLADPPRLNVPFKASGVEYVEPTNINFTWSPGSVVNNIEYNFQLRELLDGQVNPEMAFLTAQPLYTETTTATNLLYGPGQPLLIPGKRYGWRVEAKNQGQLNGQGYFKNNGFSEIFWFTYMQPCLAPRDITATTLTNGSVTLQWPPLTRSNGYEIEYKNEQQPQSSWITATGTLSNYTITGAARGVPYSYRVGNMCQASGNYIYSTIGQFTIPEIQNPNAVKGNISWVYKATEENEDPSSDALVSKIRIPESSSTNPIDHTAGRIAYGLSGADVQIYGTVLFGGLNCIGTGKTDRSGNYNINIPPLARIQKIIITHSSGSFSSRTRNVSVLQTQNGYQLGNDTLAVQNFQFKPSVYIPNYIWGDQVTLDVLLPETIFNQNSFIENAGLGNSSNVVMYNQEKYILIATITNRIAFKKLLYNNQQSEHYVVRINYQNRPAVFYPLAAVLATANSNGQKPVTLLKKTFDYTLTTTVEGKISYKNTPRRDVKMGISIKKTDILGDHIPASTSDYINYETTTDANGWYSYELPPLKNDAVINFQVADYSIRHATFPATAVYTGSNPLRKDIDLVNHVYTIVGRLMDQDNFPIANALVSSLATNTETRTTDKGYYSLKVCRSDYIYFKADERKDTSKYVEIKTEHDVHPGETPVTAAEWKRAIETSGLFLMNIGTFPNNEITADILGIGTGSLINKYYDYVGQEEVLKGVISLGETQLPLQKGKLKLIASLNGQPVKANVKLSNGIEATTVAGNVFEQSLQKGHYTITVSTFPGRTPFVPFVGEFDISPNTNTDIVAILMEGAIVSGIIKDKNSNNPIDSTLVEITGMPYSSLSNKQGEYSIIVPKGKEFEYHLSQSKYNSTDTSFLTINDKTVNFRLEMRDPNIPALITMSGFPIKIDKQASGGYGTYIISGKLRTKHSDIFDTGTDAEGNELNFRDITVKVDATKAGNAIPLTDVLFEEAVMETKAFGFVSVEIEGFPQIMMKGLKENGQVGWKHTTIGGAAIKALLSDVTGTGPVPLKMRNANLISRDPGIVAENEARKNQGLKPFFYVYASPGYPINALASSQRFGLTFEENPDNVPINTSGVSYLQDTLKKYIKTSLGIIGDRIANLYLHKTNGDMGADGFELEGFLKSGKVYEFVSKDSGVITIDKLSLDKQFGIKEFTFLVSEKNPKIYKVQKLKLAITKVSLYGVGTPNFGIGFGGSCTIAKENPKKYPDTLTIQSLSIVNSGDGIAFAGKFSFPKNGLSIKSMIITTPNNGFFAFSFIPAKSSYVFEAEDLQLGYTASRAPVNPQSNESSSSFLKSVFPILIQSLSIDFDNWNVFMVAKKNITLDLKVVKFNVEKLLVSIGYNRTMDEMNAYLTAAPGTPASNIRPDSGPEDEMLDEERVSWAVGIKGGLEFKVGGVGAAVAGSFLIGNINNSIDARLNEFELKIENTAFKLKAKVKLAFSDAKQGFEADASLTALKKDFEAGFKFYHISAGPGVKEGIELGAVIKVSAGITTGPVLWHSIGGGFNFNTSTNVYNVFLTGDVGPAGTPKEVGYIANGRIDVLFDVNNCDGYPVISGRGDIMIKNNKWGEVGAKVDFCRKLFLVTIGLTVKAAPGVDVYVTGTLFGITKDGQSGSLFLGVNANITTMGDLLNGNVFLAIGVNYNNNDPLSPQEVKDLWNQIHKEAKDNDGTVLNALFISGSLNVPTRNGSFDVSIGPFPLFGFAYDFGGSAHAMLFVKYNSNLFKFKGDIEAHANGRITVLGASLYGNGSITVAVNGGYDGSWYVNGSAGLDLQLYTHPNAGCNSFYIETRECCCVNWTDVPCCSLPCTDCSCLWTCTRRTCLTYPVDLGFKICLSLNAGFDYRQGQATNVYLK